MSVFTIFDWISPLAQAATPGETMRLTAAEMNYLEANGITVHTLSAFDDLFNPGCYCVKVSDGQRARELLGR